MTLEKKTLFVPVVEKEKLNPHFVLMMDSPSYNPTRTMLDLIYQDFEDPDGNFLEQFQTTGFDSRFFEIYLFAYFSRSGFTIDRTHPNPDFIVTRGGATVSVEATTINPSTRDSTDDQSTLPEEPSFQEFVRFRDQELPIRFGSPLFSKLQKKYWELDHCKNRPLVLAIEAFQNEDALTYSDNSLAQFLYGLRLSADWSDEGVLEIKTDIIATHESGSKKIPSNFFAQPDTEYISAVVFTNSGTLSKFTRMGYQQGFGTDHYDISRFGFAYNPDPNAKDPTYFSYSLTEPPVVESWGQGLVVNHNPNALFPLSREFFPEAVQGYIEDGQYKADLPEWHPIMSKTIIGHFANPKDRPPRIPRVTVFAISKDMFDHIRGFRNDKSNPVFVEDGWFVDETESFLGVVIWDKPDQDWGYVILARDEFFQFRAIKTPAASRPDRDMTRRELQFEMGKLASENQRIFPQGKLDSP